MNCEEIQQQLSGWIDGELTDGQRSLIEAHLEDCDVCRTLTGELSDVAGRWRSVARLEKRRADRVAEEAIARLDASADELAPAVRKTSAVRSIAMVLASAAVGFIAALLIFPPRTPSTTSHPPIVANPPLPVATLVRAIGDVKVRKDNEDLTALADSLSLFTCPSDSVVETGNGAVCELKTTNGSVVRLDNGTRLILRQADEVALDRGRIACEAATGKELRVVAADQKVNPTNDFPVMSCKSSACMWSAKENGKLQVASTAGEVEVVSKTQKQTLTSGESAEIVSGEILPVSRSGDPLLATRWMHPLLILHGPDNPALGRRVDQLLARIGQSKLSHLYEDEIRSLGEHAVLPLVRFLQSPLSNDDVRRTRIASRIVSDLAVTWTIGDLVRLLEHDDPQVRVDASTALKRLTGLTHGRAPAEWKAGASENAEALGKWKAWWEQNRSRYPSLDLNTRS